MSELDVQKILTEAASVHNLTDKRGKLKVKATRWLRKKERESKEEERDRIKAQLAYTGPGAGSADQKANAAKWMHHLEEDLEDNSPPELTTGEERDAVAKRIKELDAFIVEGMPTLEDQRRNPPGAVDRHMQWESRVKTSILERHNLLIAQQRDNTAQDFANVEMIRPRGTTSGVLASSSFMPDAQIPGVFGMTPLAKQNWPEGMPEYGTLNSALAQATAREQELAALNDSLIKRLEVLEGRIASEDAKKAEHARKCKEGLDRAREKRNKAEDKKMQKEIDRIEGEKKAQAG